MNASSVIKISPSVKYAISLSVPDDRYLTNKVKSVIPSASETGRYGLVRRRCLAGGQPAVPGGGHPVCQF